MVKQSSLHLSDILWIYPLVGALRLFCPTKYEINMHWISKAMGEMKAMEMKSVFLMFIFYK